MAENKEKHGEMDKLSSFEELITLSLLRNKIYYETSIHKSKLLENENNALNEELNMLKGLVASKDAEVILRKHLLESDSKNFKTLELTTVFLRENEERAKAKFKRQYARVMENRRIQEAQIVKISEILKKRKEHPLMQPWVKKLEEQENMLKESEELIANLEMTLKDRQAEFFRFQRDSIIKRKDRVIPSNIILQNFNLLVVEIAKNKLESINLEKEVAKLRSEIGSLNGVLSSNKNFHQAYNTLNSFFPEPTYDTVQSENYLDRFTESIKIPCANSLTVSNFFNQLSQNYSNIANNNTTIGENKGGTNLTSFSIDQRPQTDSLEQSCSPSASNTFTENRDLKHHTYHSNNSRDLLKSIDNAESDSVQLISNDSQHVEDIRSSGSQSPDIFGSQPMKYKLSQHLSKSQQMEPSLSEQLNKSQPMISLSQQVKRSQPTETNLSQQSDKSRSKEISLSQQIKRSQPTETNLSQRSDKSRSMGISLSQQFKKSRPMDSSHSQQLNKSQSMTSSFSQPMNRSQTNEFEKQTPTSQHSKRSCATNESFSLGQPIQFEPTQGTQALSVSKGSPEISLHVAPNSGSNNSFDTVESPSASDLVPYNFEVNCGESYTVTCASLFNTIPSKNAPKINCPLPPVNNVESPSGSDRLRNMLGIFSLQDECEPAKSPTSFNF